MSESFFPRQTRIVSALVIREMNTRFGREGLGFMWLIVEPLIFCFGVLILWSLTKPEYEHGIRVAPFTMTGYMSLILMRHMVGQFSGALGANIGLLHHRHLKPIHIFISRAVLEFLGTTAAFLVVYVVLLCIEQVDLPYDYLSVYVGWLTVAWVGIGFALLLSGLALRFEPLEKMVPLLGYILVPVSGAFTMVSWIPASLREIFLILPFAHGIELIRHGVFGEFTETYYNIPYALTLGTIMVIIGLLLIASARDQIDVD